MLGLRPAGPLLHKRRDDHCTATGRARNSRAGQAGHLLHQATVPFELRVLVEDTGFGAQKSANENRVQTETRQLPDQKAIETAKSQVSQKSGDRLRTKTRQINDRAINIGITSSATRSRSSKPASSAVCRAPRSRSWSGIAEASTHFVSTRERVMCTRKE